MAGAMIGAVLSKIGRKSRRSRSIVIDNFCFRLHYKVTFYLLLALGLFVTGQHYIDSPINCHAVISSVGNIPAPILNSYCWVHGTYSKHETLSAASVAGSSQQTSPHRSDTSGKNQQPGNAVSGSGLASPGGSTTVPADRHDYYQWVSLFLLMQSVFFYLPHWLWRQWEGGYLRHLVQTFGNYSSELSSSSHRFSRQASEELSETQPLHQDIDGGLREHVVEYLCGHLGRHAYYGYAYVAFEVLNFVNVCGQFLWTDHFLGGRFLGYGWRVLTWNDHQDHTYLDPQLSVFPRVAKCVYRRFGNAGSIERHDAICVLPLNAVNAKVYTILWVWLALLAVVSAAAILYRFLLLLFPYVRWTKKLFLLNSLTSSSAISPTRIHKTSPRLYGVDFSDWFVINYLCKNIMGLDYQRLVGDLDAALHSSVEPPATAPPPYGPPSSGPQSPQDSICYFDQNIASQSAAQTNSFQPYSCNHVV